MNLAKARSRKVIEIEPAKILAYSASKIVSSFVSTNTSLVKNLAEARSSQRNFDFCKVKRVNAIK